jgi:hypothetical protein
MMPPLKVSIGLLCGLVASAALGCDDGAAPNEPSASEQNKTMQQGIKADLEKARATRIFFSHHSVGGNLLSGARKLSAEAGAELRVVALEKAEPSTEPAWLHASGGKNGDPKSKIDFFLSTLRSQTALKPELAFMKFCYVDFNPSTDVDDLFSHYERALSTLKQERPEIRFAHVTVPLVERPKEMKWKIYRLIGREVWEDAANVRRHAFNQRLLKTFAADPIFDLARAESTRPDGTRESFQHAGATYYSLEPRYTNDGGHLGELGQRVLGAEMVRFVASALKKPEAAPSN